MTIAQIEILKELVGRMHKGQSYEGLCRVAQCQKTELRYHVLPELLMNTPDKPATVAWSGQRFYITEEGMKELGKRNLVSDAEWEKFRAAA